MDTKAIRELAEVMKSTGLSLIEVTERDFTLKLERTCGNIKNTDSTIPQYTFNSVAEEVNDTVQTDSLLKELKSQMVGTFYGSPSPDEEPFVKVGSKIKKGDVLCIIEAMKLMNEYTATEDGEIVEICANNGQLVEFGQCLFKIR